MLAGHLLCPLQIHPPLFPNLSGPGRPMTPATSTGSPVFRPVRPGQREVLWRQAGPQCPLPGLLPSGVADWLSISTQGPISPPSSLLPLLARGGGGGGNFSPVVLALASAPRLKHIHCSALAFVSSPLWNYLQITQDELRFCFLPRPT